MDRTQHVAGAVVGSAVGDALGGPFEFDPAGAFSAGYPTSSTNDEMQGGGGWDPGEATDDTQMAVMVAESLLERGGLGGAHHDVLRGRDPRRHRPRR